MSKGEAKKDRKFVLEIWSQSTDYNTSEVLDNLERQPMYAYIKHDCDTDDDGELKKEHYQACVLFRTPRTLDSVAARIGVPVNHVQFAKRWRGAERYLMHLDNPEKYQYPRSAVHTNIASFDADIGLLHEGSYMREIFERIDAGEWNPFEIAKSACSDPKLYSVVRRNWTIIYSYCRGQSALFEMAEKEREKLLKGKSAYTTIDMSIVQKLIEMEYNKQ